MDHANNVFSMFSFQNQASQRHLAPDHGTTVSCRGIEETDIEDFGAKSQQCRSRPKEGDRNREIASRTRPPPHWQRIIDEIRCMRMGKDAPVDQMGSHKLVNEAADKGTQRFQCLVAAMISSQTRDSVTAAAMKRLHTLPGGLTIAAICEDQMTIERIAEILKPVGFYRQKAKNLKEIAMKLSEPPYCGSIPSTLEELRKLPGVGPKVGLLVLWVAFGKGDEGLIVDTNVRRVCCRLGWAPNGSNPEQVRASLEPCLPKQLWPEFSFLFVGFGQQVCKPSKPLCGACRIHKLCPSATGIDRSQNGKKRKQQ